jgi:hypothetical protein
MNQVWGRALVFSGIAVICGCIALSAFNLWFPMWLGVLIGSILGVPLLIVGMRMESQSLEPTAKEEPKTFLPSPQTFRSFVWNASLSLFAFALAALPVAVFAPALWLLQGDGWSTAWLRSGIAVSMLVVLQHWGPACYRWMLVRFESTLNDDRKAAFRDTARPRGTTLRAFLMEHVLEFAWILLAVVLLSGVIPIPNIQIGGPQFRGRRANRNRSLTLALQWLSAHPHTVTASIVWMVLKIACDGIRVLVQRRRMQPGSQGLDEPSA